MTENYIPVEPQEAAEKKDQHPPMLPKEDFIAQRKAERDALFKTIDDATQEIASDPAKFTAYLDLQGRMDRYTVNNALLLYKQMPNATQLKDFAGWSDAGVRVRKGEKTIKILEPEEFTREDNSTGTRFKVKKVLDVSQTNGPRRPAPTVNRDPRRLVAVMLDTAPVPVESTDEMPHPNMGAFYDNEKQKLFVKRDIGDSVALCQCVAQELGFAQLAIDGKAYNRREMGHQATCIGYMLCRRFGVDVTPFAVNRLPETWKGMQPREIRGELTTMRSAYRDVVSRVSDELYRQKQERTREPER